jgi:hypothetical protein
MEKSLYDPFASDAACCRPVMWADELELQMSVSVACLRALDAWARCLDSGER